MKNIKKLTYLASIVIIIFIIKFSLSSDTMEQENPCKDINLGDPACDLVTNLGRKVSSQDLEIFLASQNEKKEERIGGLLQTISENYEKRKNLVEAFRGLSDEKKTEFATLLIRSTQEGLRITGKTEDWQDRDKAIYRLRAFNKIFSEMYRAEAKVKNARFNPDVNIILSYGYNSLSEMDMKEINFNNRDFIELRLKDGSKRRIPYNSEDALLIGYDYPSPGGPSHAITYYYRNPDFENPEIGLNFIHIVDEDYIAQKNEDGTYKLASSDDKIKRSIGFSQERGHEIIQDVIIRNGQYSFRYGAFLQIEQENSKLKVSANQWGESEKPNYKHALASFENGILIIPSIARSASYNDVVVEFSDNNGNKFIVSHDQTSQNKRGLLFSTNGKPADQDLQGYNLLYLDKDNIGNPKLHGDFSKSDSETFHFSNLDNIPGEITLANGKVVSNNEGEGLKDFTIKKGNFYTSPTTSTPSTPPQTGTSETLTPSTTPSSTPTTPVSSTTSSSSSSTSSSGGVSSDGSSFYTQVNEHKNKPYANLFKDEKDNLYVYGEGGNGITGYWKYSSVSGYGDTSGATGIVLDENGKEIAKLEHALSSVGSTYSSIKKLNGFTNMYIREYPYGDNPTNFDGGKSEGEYFIADESGNLHIFQGSLQVPSYDYSQRYRIDVWLKKYDGSLVKETIYLNYMNRYYDANGKLIDTKRQPTYDPLAPPEPPRVPSQRNVAQYESQYVTNAYQFTTFNNPNTPNSKSQKILASFGLV